MYNVTSNFLSLENSDLIRIFFFLSKDEIFKFSTICSRFKKISNHSPLNMSVYRLQESYLKSAATLNEQKLRSSDSGLNIEFKMKSFNLFPYNPCEIFSNACEQISKIYSITTKMYFKELQGGIVNPPILAFTMNEQIQNFLGVFKAVTVSEKVINAKLRAFESMKTKGFKHLPMIFKSKQSEFLIKIEDIFFYFIEFLNPEHTLISFEEFLMLTGSFHQESKKIPISKFLMNSKLDEYVSRSQVFFDSWFQTYDPIFKDPFWKEIVSLSQIFITDGFKCVYENLPHHLIHGDNNQTNIIFSKQIPYFIDLDSIRNDVRLLDLASYFRYGGFENYIELTKQGNIFKYINVTYGKNTNELTHAEEIFFHWIVAFSHVEFVSWALEKLKKAELYNNKNSANEFFSFIKIYIYQLRVITKILKNM